MAGRYWYIKERNNSQFKSPYYIALGNLTVPKAKEAEGSIYGLNFILKFDSKEEYLNKCKELGIEAKT
jgi:hypothetical protein